MSGLISIVGSGPGDPELITQKGIRRLRNADVVFHDKLSPNKLIQDHCPPGTDIYDVGKRKGKIGPGQDEINNMLLEAVQEHDRVVRLKGGDPFLFGRGGEETEHLAQHDVDFEIVPGVSSLTAVPASAGIPLTHRDHSSSVGVITGHFNRNASDEEHNWDALADMETLVVLMGVTKVGSIARNLIEGGKSPDTPTAIVGWGATPKQQSLVSTLGELRDGLDQPKPYLPGLIIIGSVVGCRSSLNWYENKPLFGKKIIVTRPRNQSDRLTKKLEEAGAQTVSCPTIRIEPLDEGLSKLQSELEHLPSYDWLVFTSRNAVLYFFKTLSESNFDIRSLGNLKFAAIGPGTAERIQEERIQPDLIPEIHQAEKLTDALIDRLESNSKILLPRSADARSHMNDRLVDAGHEVVEISTYHAALPDESTRDRLEELLSDSTVDMITFTSSSTVENLFEGLDSNKIKPGLRNMARAAIGPITAETLENHGYESCLVPENYNLSDFFEAIVEFLNRDPQHDNTRSQGA